MQHFTEFICYCATSPRELEERMNELAAERNGRVSVVGFAAGQPYEQVDGTVEYNLAVLLQVGRRKTDAETSAEGR